MITRTNLVRLFFADAITVWPFILVTSRPLGITEREVLLTHEKIHLAQQRRWAIYGLGLGLLVWFGLYLLCLPIGWNYWRRKWEREAYRANGLSDEAINTLLRLAPYYLWR
jgi:hypothetical protein